MCNERVVSEKVTCSNTEAKESKKVEEEGA